MNLSNATVVVTGGAGGLGSLICKTFAEHGARVAVVDQNNEQLEQVVTSLKSSAFEVAAFSCDVTDEEKVDSMFSEIENRFGPTDILFNCAGTLRGIGSICDVNIHDWKNDVFVSLLGSFFCSRRVLKQMKARNRGYIINMFGGGLKPQPYMSGYVCAKAAVLLLTEELSNEVVDYNVNVFAIRPGPVRTAMNDYVMQSEAGRRWRPDFKKIFDEGHATDIGVVANLAIQLCSGRADMLTGRLFDATKNFDEIIASSDRVICEDLLTMRVRDIPFKKSKEPKFLPKL
ncbi:MAG: SDR family oxidoreductase [Bacteroidetes bacterium]|nr:SDR family oxidoreductase [Bacteroidota bacterium]